VLVSYGPVLNLLQVVVSHGRVHLTGGYLTGGPLPLQAGILQAGTPHRRVPQAGTSQTCTADESTSINGRCCFQKPYTTQLPKLSIRRNYLRKLVPAARHPRKGKKTFWGGGAPWAQVVKEKVLHGEESRGVPLGMVKKRALHGGHRGGILLGIVVKEMIPQLGVSHFSSKKEGCL
jgi:hypothetical protein